MKFNKGSPRYQYRQGDEKIESRSEEKDLSCEEQAERAGFVQPGKKKPLRKTWSSFSVPKGGLKKVGRDSSVEPVVIRQNDFKLKDGRFVLDTR